MTPTSERDAQPMASSFRHESHSPQPWMHSTTTGSFSANSVTRAPVATITPENSCPWNNRIFGDSALVITEPALENFEIRGADTRVGHSHQNFTGFQLGDAE